MPALSKANNSLVKMASDRLIYAEEDNQKIYLDEVPRELPEIRAQSMVKQNLSLAPTVLKGKISKSFTFGPTPPFH